MHNDVRSLSISTVLKLKCGLTSDSLFSFSAVALFLADQWWTIDDIVRTSVLSREGLQQVNSTVATLNRVF